MKIADKKQWGHRLNILKETVDYWIKNETDKTIETVQLFFDQN
jgi:hypothetical protein